MSVFFLATGVATDGSKGDSSLVLGREGADVIYCFDCVCTLPKFLL